MKPKIYFRADGNAKTGLGHVIRSLALADMLKDEFSCHFIIRNPLPIIQKQILEVCKSVIILPEPQDDLEEANQIAKTYLQNSDIVVLDGYHYITAYQKIIKDKGCKLVCIDDIHKYHFLADVVVNHALGINASHYSCENFTKIYLGFKYCLLRKPFLEVAKKVRTNRVVKNIFICFGGSDYYNLTLKAIKAVVNHCPSIDSINVVLGEANIYKDKVCEYIDTIDTDQIKFQTYSNLSAEGICNLMTKNELAIVPASTISMECFAAKLKVICGYFVANQIQYYNTLKRYEMIIPADDYYSISTNKLGTVIKSAIKDNSQKNHLILGDIPKRYLKIFKSL